MTYNYEVGIGPVSKEDKDKYENVVEFNGVLYIKVGTTYNTSIKAKVGDTLSVYVAEIKVGEVNGKKKFTHDNPIPNHLSEPGIPVTTPAKAEIISQWKRTVAKMVTQEINLVEDEDHTENVVSALKKYNYYLDVPTGKKQFVYQHHWRGLSEDEAKGPEKNVDVSHSLHGDLRLSQDGYLIGYTIFLGDAKENMSSSGDKLISMTFDKKLQIGLKLTQPKAWLDVQGPSEPGQVGATSQTWATFYIEDSGTYEVGVRREHFHEFFLKGKKLKGRYIVSYAPVAIQKEEVFNFEELFLEDSDIVLGDGRRIWLVSKPKDQRPYAETHDLIDVIKELKSKNQKYLIWASPSIKPQKIDIEKYQIKEVELSNKTSVLK